MAVIYISRYASSKIKCSIYKENLYSYLYILRQFNFILGKAAIGTCPYDHSPIAECLDLQL